MGLIQNKVKVSQPNSHVVVKNAGGLRGLTGEQGVPGPQGDPGQAATITVGTTTTLPAGSNATVQNVGSTSAAIFNFGIPQGEKGDTGESGAAATISVGATTTLEPGEDATVTNSGTSSAAVFDFGIPQGAKGDTGSQGPAGQDGADGFSPTATVTKTGDTATITITDKDGTTTAQISDGVTPTIDPALSPTSENPVQNKVVTNALAGKADKPIIVSSLPTTGTAGQEYFVDDRYNTVTELKGDTEQTTYSGKNLLNVNFTSSTSGGVIITNNGDGTITASGTTTGAVACNLSPASINNLVLQNGKTYTQRVEVISGDFNLRIVPAFRNSGGTVTYNYFINNQSKTTTDTMTCVGYDMYTSTTYLPVGSSVNFTIRVWLEEGSDLSSPYEPYVGGVASPNPDYPQAVQTVTGEQTVTVVGKNLFNKAAIATGKIVSRTDGTLADNVSYGATEYIPVVAGQQYRFTAGFNYWYTAVYDKDKKYVSNVDNAQTITIPAGVSYIRSSVYLSQLNDAQFEKGSTSTPYEPYQGGSYPINLGKNLLDESTMEQGTFSYVDGYESAHTGVIRMDSYMPCQPNTTYTLSSDSALGEVGVVYKDNSGTVVQGFAQSAETITSYSFTTKPNVYQMRVRVGKGAYPHTAGTDYKLQLELGSTATTYAPYFTPIELCKIGTYQDYIYKSGEDWYLHKEVGKKVLDGSIAPDMVNSQQTNTTLADWYNFVPEATGAEARGGFSNYMSFNDTVWSSDVEGFCYSITNEAFYFRLNKTTIGTTTSSVQTWLQSHPTNFYYIIKATDTQITNSALIAQLEALAGAKIMVDGGTATVTSEYLPATLTTAYSSNSGYIDYIYDGTNFVKVR